MRETPNWSDPVAHLTRHVPDTAMLYFAPSALQHTARRFQAGFAGLVTYAVKANPGDEVLANLVAAGIRAFDVASPREMYAVRAACPDAALHYNNPVRSKEEIAVAIGLGVRSFSVDCPGELDKLAQVPAGAEMSVRLALPVKGAAYDFGEKFGVGPEDAAELLRQVARRGFTPSLTFHPGTQCADPAAWQAYIRAAAKVASDAGVGPSRLNVGGGFAAHRTGEAPDLKTIFKAISGEVIRCFGAEAPALVCEPGRAMTAEAFTLASRVKAVRQGGPIFLNDGIYGGLAEARDMVMTDRVRVLSPNGAWRRGNPVKRVVYGPTCDSIDRLPDPLDLPCDMVEGDYVLFDGMGAYSRSLSTGFNGYGLGDPVTVAALRAA
ncbi:MAG: type III PLP-dependent enzyme [Roseovarius sp.]|nr:type III PLP-dependent enzyme [Roseovarius sp.]